MGNNISDTDWQKKHGLGYAKLAAAAAASEQAVPVPAFDTDEIRTNQRQTIRVLTEENARLLRVQAGLKEQLKTQEQTITRHASALAYTRNRLIDIFAKFTRETFPLGFYVWDEVHGWLNNNTAWTETPDAGVLYKSNCELAEQVRRLQAENHNLEQEIVANENHHADIPPAPEKPHHGPAGVKPIRQVWLDATHFNFVSEGLTSCTWTWEILRPHRVNQFGWWIDPILFEAKHWETGEVIPLEANMP